MHYLTMTTRPILIAAALAATSTPAFAATPEDAMRWEMAYQGLSALDAAETIYCLKHVSGCEEANPLLGKHPGPAKIIASKIILGGLHFVLVSRLAHKNPKQALRIAQISVGFQGAVVGLNARIVF